MKTIINDIWDKLLYAFSLFNSIKILSNPIWNFILKIGIVLFYFIILKFILKFIFGRRQVKKHKTVRTIDQCVSEEDLKFQMAQAEEEVLDAIQKNRQEIKNTLKRANNTIDVSWVDSCNKILRISNTLDNNLAYYRKRNLDKSKFQYYASLHFRSMIAADFVHNEYNKVDKSFREINHFIVDMKSRPEFRGNYKNQVHQQKDQIKYIRNFYLNRVHNMNHQTEILRDKIGSECGDRGRRWWIERTRHKN